MVCDLAETYHILNYRSLPPTLVATLVVGLREDSRLRQKRSGVKSSQDNILLASISDRLGLIFASLTGTKVPESIVDKLIETEVEETKDYVTFDSIEEYRRARYGDT